MLPFRTVFLIFIIFSFTGWVAEVLYVGITSAHKFINRGFLHGPLCPVYGFGGLVILLLPPFLYKTWVPLFFASMILCTCVEYFVSWIMEKMFHTRWWDYSHYKIQLNGRICLLNSVLFGFMGLGMIHYVYPFLLYFLAGINRFLLKVSSDFILAALFADLFVTVRKLVDFNMTMEKLHTMGESLREYYGHEIWFKNGTLAEMFASVKEYSEKEKGRISQNLLETIDNLQKNRQKTIETLIKKFPSMQSVRYKQELAQLKLSLLKMELRDKIRGEDKKKGK